MDINSILTSVGSLRFSIVPQQLNINWVVLFNGERIGVIVKGMDGYTAHWDYPNAGWQDSLPSGMDAFMLIITKANASNGVLPR